MRMPKRDHSSIKTSRLSNSIYTTKNSIPKKRSCGVTLADLLAIPETKFKIFLNERQLCEVTNIPRDLFEGGEINGRQLIKWYIESDLELQSGDRIAVYEYEGNNRKMVYVYSV